jgi:hypothetical protein
MPPAICQQAYSCRIGQNVERSRGGFADAIGASPRDRLTCSNGLNSRWRLIAGGWAVRLFLGGLIKGRPYPDGLPIPRPFDPL